MHISKAARRYASALLQLAQEKDELEQILEDIRFIKNTVDDSRELILLLRSPIVKRDDKIKILKELFEEHVSDVTVLFIDLLVKKGRENLLDQITHSFVDQYNKLVGIIHISVMTASDLNDQQVERFKQALKDRTNKDVLLDLSTDKKLIGGAAVRIDDTVIDGTVKNKLEQLESLLYETAV